MSSKMVPIGDLTYGPRVIFDKIRRLRYTSTPKTSLLEREN